MDAVVVATPDHWHALATVWACQAGKDVYVEKPPTHNCWEGRKMVEAARKYKRIVQVGTQNRSAPTTWQPRSTSRTASSARSTSAASSTRRSGPTFPPCPTAIRPPGFDWDLFNGPAPRGQRTTPTIAAIGTTSGATPAATSSTTRIHQIDLARWLLGVDYPKTVYSTGRAVSTSRARRKRPTRNWPSFDFDGLVLSFELTLYTPYMLKISPIIRQSDTEFPYWPQCATRIEIYGSKGLMVVGRHGGGWQVFVRPKLHEGVVKDQKKGRFPDPGAQGELRRIASARGRRPTPTSKKGIAACCWRTWPTSATAWAGRS